MMTRVSWPSLFMAQALLIIACDGHRDDLRNHDVEILEEELRMSAEPLNAPDEVEFCLADRASNDQRRSTKETVRSEREPVRAKSKNAPRQSCARSAKDPPSASLLR